MAAGLYDFLVEQGAYFERELTVRDADGEFRDLDGFTARMSFRRRIQDTEPYFTATTENGLITLGTDGGILIVIPSEITATFASKGVYDLELVDEFGEVERLLEGEVRFSREVTR